MGKSWRESAALACAFGALLLLSAGCSGAGRAAAGAIGGAADDLARGARVGSVADDAAGGIRAGGTSAGAAADDPARGVAAAGAVGDDSARAATIKRTQIDAAEARLVQNLSREQRAELTELFRTSACWTASRLVSGRLPSAEEIQEFARDKHADLALSRYRNLRAVHLASIGRELHRSFEAAQNLAAAPGESRREREARHQQIREHLAELVCNSVRLR